MWAPPPGPPPSSRLKPPKQLKQLLVVAAIAALTSSASSQIFSEDFSSGTPPTGWTIIDYTGSGVIGWEPGYLDTFSGLDHTGWAMHDYDTLLSADNVLLSPVIDLSSSSGTVLSFLTETEWWRTTQTLLAMGFRP